MKQFSNKHGIMLILTVVISTIIIAITAVIYETETYRFYKFKNKDNVIVVIPIFTSTAYQKHGFYDYYRSECNSDCLSLSINYQLNRTSSKDAVEVLKWYKFKMITDIDVNNNPKILLEYKTVIILHNEYVTQNEFNAITSHPNVIYLYPNALYGKVNYDNYKITLIRGHGFPESEIANGFDWKDDNHDMEYDTKCLNWNFYKISNGYMLNCYPELVIKQRVDILKKLDEILQ